MFDAIIKISGIAGPYPIVASVLGVGLGDPAMITGYFGIVVALIGAAMMVYKQWERAKQTRKEREDDDRKREEADRLVGVTNTLKLQSLDESFKSLVKMEQTDRDEVKKEHHDIWQAITANTKRIGENSERIAKINGYSGRE